MNDWSSSPPGTGWSTDGLETNDAVVLGPTDVLTWTGSRGVRFGRLHVVIDADTAPSGAVGTCVVALTTTPFAGGAPTTTMATLQEGTHAYALSDPEVKVQELKIDCASAIGGLATIDWVVLQNSDVPFAPAGDLDLTWWDTDMPEGGYDTHAVLRGGQLCDLPCESTYETLLASGDVSGFAIYDDAQDEWIAINGDPTTGSFLYQDVDVDAHDIAWVDDGSAEGLLLGVTAHVTGNEGVRGLRGQLLASSDTGKTWTPLANGYSSGSADPAVAATRRQDPWGKKDHPGGRLIQPTSTGQAFVANHVGGEPSLVLLDSAGALCAVDTGGTLPEASNWDDGSPHDLLVALAWASHPISNEHLVFAGYRQRDLDTDPAVIQDSLFRCTYTGEPNCSETPTCGALPGSEGIDVADLEVDSSSGSDMHVYVADLGRRDRNDSGAVPDTSHCLDAGASISAGDVCGPRVWRWTAKVSDYTAASDTLQDIVSPVMSDGLTFSGRKPQAVSGLSLSSNNVWLTAFTPNGHAGWYSSDAPAWRISLSEAEVIDDTGYPVGWPPLTTTGWISLSDDKFINPGYTAATVSTADDDMHGEYLRETGLDPGNTWMADQAFTAWQAEMYDGVAYQETGSSEVFLVGNTAFGFWAWHTNSAGSYGPESAMLDGALVETVDEDTAIGATFFDNAGDTGSTTFQGTVVRDVAFGWDGRVWVLDLDNGFVYEDEGASTRAVRPPQNGTLAAGGQAVATAEVKGGDEGAVWLGMYDKTGAGDTPSRQAILRSADGGDTFCYQGVIESGIAGDLQAINRSIVAATTKYIGDKADEVFHRYTFSHTVWPYPVFDGEDWVPCDSGGPGGPTQDGIAFREMMSLEGSSHDMSWGNPLDIVALDEDLAVATFASYRAERDLDDLAFTADQSIPGRVGYTLDGGTTWSELDFSDALTAPACTGLADLQYDLFGKMAQLELLVDTTWYTSAQEWGLDLFLLGQDSGQLYEDGDEHCALWRVTVVTTAGPSTTTTRTPVSVPDGTGSCTVRRPSSMARSPWTDRLMIWGGYHRLRDPPDAYHERGGMCLIDYDGSNASSVIDPEDGYRFSIMDAVPNPLVQDQWVVTPFVDDLVQDQCAREYFDTRWSTNEEDVYDACDLPVPFIVQRRSPGEPGADWVTTDLAIDGLNSLEGVTLDLATGLVESPPGTWSVDWSLLYGTSGTGAFRGVATW